MVDGTGSDAPTPAETSTGEPSTGDTAPGEAPPDERAPDDRSEDPTVHIDVAAEEAAPADAAAPAADGAPTEAGRAGSRAGRRLGRVVRSHGIHPGPAQGRSHVRRESDSFAIDDGAVELEARGRGTRGQPRRTIRRQASAGDPARRKRVDSTTWPVVANTFE